MIGDLNAKVGSDNSGYEECMGREGEGVGSENGCLLKDLCHENGLVIGRNSFQAQEGSQNDVDLPRSENYQPDRSCDD